MIPIFGYGVLILTFAVALYGIGAAVYGALYAQKDAAAWVESSRRAMLLTFPLITVAVAVVVYLLTTGHYEVQFVYSVTSSTMPPYLKATALWGGQSGSLLFWSWLMSAFAAAVTLRRWQRDLEFLPWVIVVSLVTLAFFLGLIIFVKGQVPFERFWQLADGSNTASVFQPAGSTLLVPPDGNGLNPLLRHPGMIIHPPMLYLGFVSFVIPFAFGIAALITGRTDDRWIRVTRRWTLVAWLFLSLGLVLGMWWAYDVLGWGGYWGWDPVEIAALMPWLTGTAFLHSVMIQEKRGLFKRWNMVLIVLTYALVIFGTFLTRSGVLSSVHAFSQSAIGPLFFAFIGITFAVSLGLLLYRWNDLRSQGQMTSLLSRESLFLVNNLLFIGVLVVCFWGVIFPLISELFTGQKVTVGPPFYLRATGPLFGGLLFLMGVAPLSAWTHSTYKTLGRAAWKPALVSLLALAAILLLGVRSWIALLGFWLVALTVCLTLYEYGREVYSRHKSTGEGLPLAFWRLTGRNRRRYGGFIIHLSIAIMALGIIGIQVFQTSTQGTLQPGGTLELSGYTVKFKELAVFDAADGHNVARAALQISRGGQVLGELFPRRDYYYESQQPVTIPGVRSTFEDDLYVVLVDWQASGVTFKVFHNPLVLWLWTGALLFTLGMVVAAWPDGETEAERRAAVGRVMVRA